MVEQTLSIPVLLKSVSGMHKMSTYLRLHLFVTSYYVEYLGHNSRCISWHGSGTWAGPLVPRGLRKFGPSNSPHAPPPAITIFATVSSQLFFMYDLCFVIRTPLYPPLNSDSHRVYQITAIFILRSLLFFQYGSD